MTWLKGNSTWGTLSNDLTRLICGEIPDASAVSTAVGDRWVREITRSVSDGVTNSTTTVTSATAAFTSADVGASVYGTGIPVPATIASVTNGTTVVLSAAATASASGVTLQICSETIRTPAAKDVSTGAMSNRAGYFAAIGVVGTNMSPAATSVARVTNPFTTDPSTSGFHRWLVLLRVSAVNSVAGNYSTAQIAINVVDTDNNVLLTSTTNTAPTAGGVLTVVSGLQVTLSDPSGFLTLSTQFARAFTSSYMYGIDWWPMLHRLGTATPSFSVAPPGVAGTDYDIVSFITPQQGAAVLGNGDRGHFFHGLGIKTATGLGAGALYTVSHSMALIKCRIFNNPTTAGILSLDVGSSKRDATGSAVGTYRPGNIRVTTWAKMFQTSTSVTAGSLVQYWLSVTNDGVFVALNADPGQTGKLGTAFIGTYVPAEPTYDVFPVIYNVGVADYTANTAGTGWFMSTQFGYWMQRRHMDGSEAPRDWQTGWMRSEHFMSQNHYAGLQTLDLTTVVAAPSSAAGGQAYGLTPIGMGTDQTNPGITAPSRQNKPTPDGKWWLYGLTFAEGTSWAIASSNTTDENRFVRSSAFNRFFFIPDLGWGPGDELTDTVSGAKYLLLTPDYIGAGGRMQIATSSYQGGTAVLEA